MKKCRGCGWAHYCSSKCQEEHWRPSATRRGHKAECDLIAVAYDHARRRDGDLRSTPAVRSSCGIVSLYTWAVWRHVFARMYPEPVAALPSPVPCPPVVGSAWLAAENSLPCPFHFDGLLTRRAPRPSPRPSAAPVEVARTIAQLLSAAPRPSSTVPRQPVGLRTTDAAAEGAAPRLSSPAPVVGRISDATAAALRAPVLGAPMDDAVRAELRRIEGAAWHAAARALECGEGELVRCIGAPR